MEARRELKIFLELTEEEAFQLLTLMGASYDPVAEKFRGILCELLRIDE
jgi:hypothetical protein